MTPETVSETSAVNRILKAIEDGGYTPRSREDILTDVRTWESYGEGGMWELVDRYEATFDDNDDPYDTDDSHDTESYRGEPVYDGDW